MQVQTTSGSIRVNFGQKDGLEMVTHSRPLTLVILLVVLGQSVDLGTHDTLRKICWHWPDIHVLTQV
jgi:hypothetical protein